MRWNGAAVFRTGAKPELSAYQDKVAQATSVDHVLGDGASSFQQQRRAAEERTKAVQRHARKRAAARMSAQHTRPDAARWEDPLEVKAVNTDSGRTLESRVGPKGAYQAYRERKRTQRRVLYDSATRIAVEEEGRRLAREMRR